MEKRYRVMLTVEERRDLQKLVSTGKAAARKLMRARVLLTNPKVAAPGGRGSAGRARRRGRTSRKINFGNPHYVS